MWWESVNVCYWMLLKGGMWKQGDSNIVLIPCKEAESSTAHGYTRHDKG